jgi:hypothetical protein
MVKGGILDTSSKVASDGVLKVNTDASSKVASDGILKVNTDASSKVNIGRNTKGEYRTHH